MPLCAAPSPTCLTDEVAKLQQHLELLREQYVRLQQRNSELERKYTQAVSSSGDLGPEHFVTRLLALTADLFDKPLYRLVTLDGVFMLTAKSHET